MVSSGLLLCSFYLKKRFQRGNDEPIPLNETFEFNDDDEKAHSYSDIFEMIRQFCTFNADGADDEKSMKLFSINPKSIKEYDESAYKAMSFIISSGSYGLESTITDRRTREIKYQCGEDDASVKDFRCLVFVPKDTDTVQVSKGILIFQTLGAYGVKTITVKQMKAFFSGIDLTLETRSVSVRLFIEKLIEKGSLYKVTMIRNKVSPDSSDNMLVSTGREERSYIHPTFKQTWIAKFLDAVGGNKGTDLLEFDDNTYEDITVTFKLGHGYRTVRLTEIDRFSVVEDIPESVYNDGRYNEKVLIDYMIETASTYKDKMVFTAASEV